MIPLTIEELYATDKLMLTPADVAPIIHCDPHAIRIMAHSKPESLGFPITVLRTRTLIPREPFIAWLTGSNLKAADKRESIQLTMGALEEALMTALGDTLATPLCKNIRNQISEAFLSFLEKGTVDETVRPEKGR